MLVILEESGANISTVQSAKLKEYGKKRRTDAADSASDTDRGKSRKRGKLAIKFEKNQPVFSEEYSSEEIEGLSWVMEEMAEEQ